MTKPSNAKSPGESTGKTWLRKAMVILCWVVGFVAAKMIVQSYFDKQAFKTAGAEANKSMEELRAKAVAEHPDQPAAFAIHDEAIQRSSEELAQKSGNQKANEAAGQFIGFYMINVRTRHDYCKDLGVDISTYTKAFAAEHEALYAKSRTILGRGPYSPDKIEDMTYEQLQPILQKTISEGMATLAKQNKVTEKDICQGYSDKGAELASEMHLSKVNPALYQAMLDAR